MVASSWPTAYKMVRAEEGGNDDDPHDPGGRTSRGITQREYNAWRRLHNLAPRDVWSASEDEIMSIYKTQYWDPWGDKLPPGVDAEFFDMCVLQGPGRAATTLQQALGGPARGVAIDGRMGLVTLQHAQDATDKAALIRSITQARLAFFRRIRGWVYYGRGWTNRAYICQRIALSLLSPVAGFGGFGDDFGQGDGGADTSGGLPPS